jgi:Flp pilus assembly protein TadG
MARVVLLKALSLRPLGNHFRKFAKDEDGGILMFVVILFLMMVVVSGGAVDFMRQEVERARLQDSLDRGVLAAASFTQSMDEEETVRAYLDSARVPASATLAVLPSEDGNTRKVSAQAEYDLRTFFLKIIGIRDLTVAAQASASQSQGNLEISLVLDITPSMKGTKMANLKVAAAEFIDTILTEDSKDVTSVNLIPYGGQTNPGAALFGKLNVARIHDYSSCVTFEDAAFDTTTISATTPFSQFPHFSITSNADWTWGWCPDEISAAIPMSNDADLLKQRIVDMRMHGKTGIQNALKWGAAMLDPAIQPIMEDLAADDVISDDFADRPVAFDDAGTKKFVVLMTDGKSTNQVTVADGYYDTEEEIADLATNVLNMSNGYQEVTDATESASQLLRLCAATKAQGITIFTIAFALDMTRADGIKAAADLETCATSSGHFYEVEEFEIATAFDAIARSIQTVRLVQ